MACLLVISSFISPRANHRTDDYGGSLENRAKLLLEVCRAVREEVGDDFPVSVKLNSADFQRGGSTVEEAVQIAAWVEQTGIDVLEISGGDMETKNMLGLAERNDTRKAASTQRREAYFLEYAEVIAKVLTKTKLMVTGGFRKMSTIDYALQDGGVDLIGLGRPFLCVVDPPGQLISHSVKALPSYETDESILKWYYLPLTLIANKHKVITSLSMMMVANLLRVGNGLDIVENPGDLTMLDFCRFLWLRATAAQRLRGPKCTGTIYSYNGTSQSICLMLQCFFDQVWVDFKNILQ